MPLWTYPALLAVSLCLFITGYAWGRYIQQGFDWRYWTRRQEKMMADFSVLTAEVAKLIAYVQQPKPEDPAIQAQIDALVGQVKAANDAVAPPA